MHLTQEQFTAATVRGCRFQAASDAQVKILSMQRRVFWLNDMPLLAMRADGFYETAATLIQLIEHPILEQEVAEAATEAAEIQPVPERSAAVTSAVVTRPADRASGSPPARKARRTTASALRMPSARRAAAVPSGVADTLPAHDVMAATARIVGAYLSSRALEPDELQELIAGVHTSVSGLSKLKA